MKQLLLFCSLLFAVISASAQTNTWSGALDTNWGTPGNWSLGLPTGAHDVVIPTGSTVVLDVPGNTKSVTLNGTAALAINSTLSFSDASSFSSSSTVTWSNATINGGGTLTAAGTINVTSNNNKFISEGTTISNTGTFNMGGGGNLYITNGTFNNSAGGMFEFQSGSGSITYQAGASHVMTNSGTILLANAQTNSIEALFTNTGFISVTAGTLVLSSGIGSTLNGGTYNISSGANLTLASNVTLAGSLVGTLNGQIISTAALNVPATAALNFTGSNSFNWQSGNLNGGGVLTNNAKITLESNNNKFIYGASTLVNNATIEQIGGGLFYITDGFLNNSLLGVYDSKINSGGISYQTGANHRINNVGTIKKSGAGLFDINVEIVNSGTFTAEAGTLTLSPIQNSKLSGGAYNVSSGAVMNWSAPMLAEGNLTGVLAGPLYWNSVVNVAPGLPATFTFSGATGLIWVSGNLDGGGILTNASTLRLESNNNKFIYGGSTLINTSTITHAGGGEFYLTDGILNNSASGIYDFITGSGGLTYQTGSTHQFNNAGLLRNNNAASATVSVNLTNTGTLQSVAGILNIGSGLGNQFNGGTYNVSIGASMVLTNTITMTGSLNGLLDGTLVSNASLRVAPATTASFNFTGSSGFKWNSGSMIGGGTLDNNAALEIVSNNNKFIYESTILNNNSTITHTGGGELYLTDGTLNNNVAGIYDSKINSGSITYQTGTSHILNNFGTIKKSEAGTFTVTCLLHNMGTIAAESGTLNLASLAGGTLEGGTYNVATGAIMNITSPITLSGTLVGALNDPLNWTTVLNVVAGNPAFFNFTGTSQLNWISGDLDGGGTLTNQSKLAKLSNNNGFILGGSTLANSGNFAIIGLGELYITNGTLANMAAGTIDLQGGSISYTTGALHALTNAGLIKHTNGVVYAVTPNVTNSGVIDSQSGNLSFGAALSLNNTVTGRIIGTKQITLPSAVNYTNDGIYAPGSTSTPATLTVNGTYKSSASSVLEVNLNGLGIDESDVLHVAGAGTFNGTVAVILGFQPAVNDLFVVATSAGLTTCNLPATVAALRNGLQTTFGVSCDTNKINLIVTAIVAVPPTADPQTLCAGATVADLIATGANLQWYANSSGGTALADTTVLATGTYYVTQTIDGFESERVAVVITITTTPMPTAASPQVVAAPATISDLMATGTNLQWYANATGGTALAAATPIMSGTYYVSQTANGCESMRINVEVTVNTTPDMFPFYVDGDGDGFGAGNLVIVAAADANTPPAGYSLSGTDCDDNDNSVYQSALLFIDADGDFYDNGSATVCYGAIVPTGYAETTNGTDCDDTNINLFVGFSFFVDADNDGFGSTTAQIVCAEDANTPPTGYALNNTDCNDNDNTVYQSATFYIDADGDFYDNGSEIVCYGAAIPAGYAATTNGTDCDDTDNSIFQSVTLYVDADCDGYDNGSEIFCSGANVPPGYSETTNGPDCNDNDNTIWQSATLFIDSDADGYDNGSETICYGATLPSGYAATSLGTDCDDSNPSINPGATEIAGNGVDDNCNGSTDEGGNVTTMVAASSCGSTLANINSLVGIISYPGATAYRVRATNMATLAQQTIVRNVPNFRFPAFANYDYAATYAIDIEIQLNGVWVGYYGAACNVSTPAILVPGGAAQVTPSQCGITLPSMNTLIATTSLAGVTGYRFRVTNLTDNAAPNQVQTIDRALQWFSMPMLSTFTYGTTYQVEVAVKTNGAYTAFGSPCTITTPAVPGIDQCGAIIANDYAFVSTTSLQHVSMYRFELTNMSTSEVTVIDNMLNRFTFSQFAGYATGATYQVRVAVRTTGVWSLFGGSCNITAPGVLVASKGVATFNLPLEAKAWPNPFTEQFVLSVDHASVFQEVRIYDMLGKLIETINLAPNEYLELGSNYPAGVYNVIIGSGEQAKTLRMIKR